VQKKEIQKNNNLIKTISAITDGKQVAIIKYIINNLDKDNLFIASYTDIMESFSISKPTLIKLFKELAEKNILIKVQHKTYRFNEQALESL
jgi:DNA invertase Pin-like site-specific DNA recombinase